MRFGSGSRSRRPRQRFRGPERRSPAPQLNPERAAAARPLTAVFRRIDGTGNNVANPDWGSANTALLRIAPAAYTDGISSLAGQNRPSPRDISNVVAAQTDNILNNRNMSDWVWQWGQFLD